MSETKRTRQRIYNDSMCKRASEFLEESAEAGRGVCELAALFKVSERSIHKWRKKHPDFADAVERGLSASKAQFLRQARKNMLNTKDGGYNTPLFNSLMQKVYRDHETPLLSIENWDEAKTIQEKFELVSSAVGNGEITVEQAEKLANFLEKKAKIADLFERIANIEHKLQIVTTDECKQ